MKDMLKNDSSATALTTTTGTGLVQVGVCSRCTGPVMMPSAWSGTMEPQRTCSVCGAVEIPYHLRVIPMMPKEACK